MIKHVINCHVYYDYYRLAWAVTVEDDGTAFEHSKTWFQNHTEAMKDVNSLTEEFAVNLLEYPDLNYYLDIPEEFHVDIISTPLVPKTFPEHFIYEQ